MKKEKRRRPTNLRDDVTGSIQKDELENQNRRVKQTTKHVCNSVICYYCMRFFFLFKFRIVDKEKW
jgi:hypothetical protein